MADEKDVQALVCAAGDGRLADVQRMLRDVADLKIDAYAGDSNALEAAIQFNQVHVVRWLIQQYPSFGATMLCRAYKELASDWTSDRQAMVRMLHEHRASERSRYEPFHDPAVLNEASNWGMESVVKLLITHGADINAEDSETKLTPLITAMHGAQESIVRILLNAGALVDQRASPGVIDILQGYTPLIYAARCRLAQSVRLLLERGASVHDVDSNGETALMHAPNSRDPELITLLLKAGAVINAQSHSGETALMIAACLSNEVAVRVLLEHGASVHLVDNKNQTALIHVSSVHRVDIMTLLLEAGSSVNAQSDTGDTALMLLIRSAHYEGLTPEKPNTIRLLLERGASIDQVNNQGWTALMIAAYEGYDHVVRILLEHGASVHVQTDTGDTALTLAQKEDHIKVVGLLREYSESAADPPPRRESGFIGSVDSWESLFQAATVGDDVTVLCLLRAQVPIDKQTFAGETALMRAVWNHQVHVVRCLIEYGANVNLLDNNKRSALLKAVHIGNAEITRLVVEAGAAIDVLGNDGESALMRAASKGNEEIVQLLLENSASVDLEIPESYAFPKKNRWTALMFAASGGFVSVAKLLIQAGAAINRDEDYNGDFPLTCAAKNGHEDVVRMLIEHGAQLNAIDQTSYGSYTALGCAIIGGHKMVAQVFIECGTNLDFKNKLGDTALKCAAECGRDEFVCMLLQGGASIDECDIYGKTALMGAAQYGREECVRVLLQAGASVALQDKWKRTALMYAARSGREKCVRLLLQVGDFDAQNGQNAMICAAEDDREGCMLVLLQAGASVDGRPEKVNSALMSASSKGSEAAVRFLLSQGALTELKDSNDRTALILASIRGHARIVCLLIQGKAKENAKGNDGRDALSLAAKHGHWHVVLALVATGAYVDSVDRKERTPLMLAAKNGHARIVHILLCAGANIDAMDLGQLTAMMLAVLKGQVQIVRLLRDRGASLDIRSKNGWSALTIAADLRDNSLMRELLLTREVLMESVSYLQTGAPQTQPDDSRLSAVDLIELCNEMHGASGICLQIRARFIDVEKEIKTMTKIAQRGQMKDYKQIIEMMRIFLVKYARKPTVIHLVSSDQIVETCRQIHRQIDEFMDEHRLTPDPFIHSDWKAQFNKDSAKYKLHVEESIDMDQKTLFAELQDPNVQQEALTLLLFECEGENPESKYSEREIDFMHRIFQYVSSLTKLKITSSPEWFAPPQHVHIEAEFAHGSYGSVHHGRWNGVKVVVKCPLLQDEQSLGMFLREVDLWYKLKHHPNVIELYRACHVGKPFFVCEFAAKDTLSKFLFEKSLATAWEKLLEAARGLLYLHDVHNVVHADLKCNNILVGEVKSSKVCPAKLMDFGLSFVVPPEGIASVSTERTDQIADEVGAIQWKAPEVIDGRTRGSLASDVYSFGMCILEALKNVKGEVLPWGKFADITVKYKLLRRKELPRRPDEVSDAQWTLISRMCAWEPSDRPTMKHVVAALENLAAEN